MNQSNALTVPTFTKNMMPALPAELRDALAEQFGASMDSFGGGFNRISLKGNRFGFVEGGSRVSETINPIDVIVIGIAPEQYCAWYENKYTGEEGVAPTAVWAQNEEPPRHVPASVLQKDAEGRNQYALRRRIVVVVFEQTPTGYAPKWDSPYVFDVGGSSCFGAKLSLPNGGGEAMSLSAYISGLKASGVYPNCIPTRIVLDGRSGVPEVRFMAHKNQDGSPALLPTEAIIKALEVSKDPTTAEMLDWRRSAATTSTEAPVNAAPNPNASAVATGPAYQAQPQAQMQPQPQVMQPQAQAGVDFNAQFTQAAAFDAQPQAQVQQPQAQVQQPQVMQPQQPQQQPVMQTIQPENNAGTEALAQQMSAAIQQPQAQPQAQAQDALGAALGDLAASMQF